MFLSEASSFVAALLFSVHPVHTEAVRYDDFYLIRYFALTLAARSSENFRLKLAPRRAKRVQMGTLTT